MRKFLSLGILFLTSSIICAQAIKEQSPNQLVKVGAAVPPNYTFALGVNVLGNGGNKFLINSEYSFKNPFFITAERRFKSKLSLALTLSTNRLKLASVEKEYFSIDAVGQFYFNEYLFNSKKIEMYAGLGLGRFFLENNGNNTLNITGGGRYWFSNQYGLSLQGFGKVGLAPLNTSVLNHYQYNLGLVWRSNQDKVKVKDVLSKSEEIKKVLSIPEKEIIGNITEKETAPLLPDTKLVLLEKSQNHTEKVMEETTKIRSSTTAIDIVKTDLPVVIQNNKNDYKIGDDLEKFFNIKRIYFASDKFNIANQASIELEKIVVVMNQHPTMKIDIRSHTDCRQTVNYNKVLSEKRAFAIMNWLVKKGIDKSRLTAKGYGQSQILNNCNCLPTKKSDCTEEQHQLNRRSEFIITAL
jgi:peptidoglycan-associated lipoprotein